MPYIARCHALGNPDDQFSPDGEAFDTFESAFEALTEDMTDESMPDVDDVSARFDASMPDGFSFDVAHLTGPQYRCTIVRADATSDARVRDDDEAMTFLQHDSGMVPGSRYGDSDACASVALLVAWIMARETGEPMTFRGLDSDMALCVNDSDSPAQLLADHATDDELDAIGHDRESVLAWIDGDD